MVFISSLLFLYVLQAIFLLIGLIRTRYPKSSQQAFVSLIVAARNEAKTILECLNSLANLIYERSKLEIIIVNDRSNDGTDAIIHQFIKQNPTFKYIKIEEHESPPYLSGKAGAISRAIKNCSGDIIFITDADCVVPAHWLQETIKYFTDKVGIVAGFTVTHVSQFSLSLFDKIQALDWVYLLSVAAGAAAWKIPLSCIGNNFAIRKQAYDEVGGYEGVGFSLTEDFALLQTISRDTNWQILFPLNFNCLVHSKPVQHIKEFFIQRKRWAIGGMKVRPYGKFLITLGICAHLIVLISLIFSIKPLAIISVMLIGDLSLLVYTLKKLRHVSLLPYYPIYKIFFFFYMIVLIVMIMINKKVVWKGTIYSANIN